MHEIDPSPGDKCGVFGVFGHPQAAEFTYVGLHAQQHRGQESAGICSSDGNRIDRHAGMGLVSEVFRDPRVIERLKNPIAIGHVRYSTTGSAHSVNAQPMLVEHFGGQVAVGHNGDLINAAALRHEYEAAGSIFHTTTDTEVILHMLARASHESRPDPLARVLNALQGAFSLVFLWSDRIVAARDPWGIRPLCIGRLDDGAYCVASETCALDHVEAEYLRDVMPGEIVTLSNDGLDTRFFAEPGEVTPAHCIFEHVYFADPASYVFGDNVHAARVEMGRRLAREAPADADIVIPVPNCARCASMGYSQESGIPLDRGFTTSHYAGRSFIQPSQALRDLTVKMKLNVIKETVRGKRVCVIEDSVVRGTTTKGKLGALRKAGAREIHLRVASPPIRHPCFYGIDFKAEPDELIAAGRTVEQIRHYLGIDTLAYLSLEGMLDSVGSPAECYCAACFTGEYAVPVDRAMTKFSLERNQLRMFE